MADYNVNSQTGEQEMPDEAVSYNPGPDEKKLVNKINEFYDRGWQDRRVHEWAWFMCNAFYRGNQSVVWNAKNHELAQPIGARKTSEHFNWFQSKIRARRAKFERNRSYPEVRPATPDIDDKLNARYTERALRYQHRRLNLERRYDEALMWSMLASHGYFWLHWDERVNVRAPEPDITTGQTDIVEAELGDVGLEVGSPFELLVADPGLAFIGDQPCIMRLKVRSVEEVKARFPERAQFIKADNENDETQQKAQYIAGLATGSWAGALTGTSTRAYGKGQASDTKAGYNDTVLVKEYFEKSCPEYPQGLYAVMVSGVIVHLENELPEGFADLDNPYPCVDFPDLVHPGQYWGSTVAEQLLGVQRSYNRLRAAVDRHLRRGMFPKIIVDRRHQLTETQWTNEDNEIVEVTNFPQIPPVMPWVPPSVASDVWRTVDILREERDVISGIYAEAEGQVGKATSGFQTNLLQEATDAVHQPDILVHERAKEDLYRKLRRMMKRRYVAKRMITISGHNTEPEVFEFGSSNIDEYADVVIEAGSILPDLKAARVQSILELWTQGVYGPQQDPQAIRMVQQHLEMGTRENLYDWARADEERARLENLTFQRGSAPPPAVFCDDHEIHYRIHADDFKKAQAKGEDPATTIERVKHMLTHARYINPQSAMQIAAEYGLPVPPPPGVPIGGPGQPPAAPTMPNGQFLPPGPPQGPPPPDQGGAPPPGPAQPPQAIPPEAAPPVMP